MSIIAPSVGAGAPVVSYAPMQPDQYQQYYGQPMMSQPPPLACLPPPPGSSAMGAPQTTAPPIQGMVPQPQSYNPYGLPTPMPQPVQPPVTAMAAPQPSRAVYVDLGELQPSPEDLQHAFLPYGLVEKINARPRPDGRFHAFVSFSSVQAAARVVRLGRIQVGNRTCIVNFSMTREPPCYYDRPGLHLWVGLGARADVARDDVGLTFSQFGDVQKVEMHHAAPNNNYAIVTFCTMDTAQAAYAAKPNILDIEPAIEWFHPGEAITSAPAGMVPTAAVNYRPPSALVPAPAPVPESARKVIIRYPLSSMMMEEELRGLLQPRFGMIERLAIGMDASTSNKVAHVVFSTKEAAQKCKDESDEGKLVAADAPGLTVELADPNITSSGGAAQPSAPNAPSPTVCLQFSSPNEAETIGSEAIREIFSSHGSEGLIDVTVKERFAFVNFKDIECSTKALEQVPSMNIPGNPVAKYGFGKKAITTTTVAMSSGAVSGPGIPGVPALPSSPSGSIPTSTLASASSAPAAPPALPGGPMAPKSSTPPCDKSIRDLIDEAAQRFVDTETLDEECELILKSDNGPYFRYKTDCLRSGVGTGAMTVLEKLKAAAEQAKALEAEAAGDTPSHVREYKEEGVIPFDSKQSILLVGEGNLTFALALVKRLGSGKKVCATTLLSKEETLAKYPESEAITAELVEMGTQIGYGFDVTKSEGFENLAANDMEFDAIVFNYPVAVIDEDGETKETEDIDENTRLVWKFIKHCVQVLASKGRVYIVHPGGEPYTSWEISKTAMRVDNGLRMINRFPFRRTEYPEYQPLLPSFDPAAKYRNSLCVVLGRRKKYPAFDEMEEREVELEKIKARRRKRREREDSSRSRDRRKSRKRSRDSRERRHRSRSRDRRRDSRDRRDSRSRSRSHGRRRR